MAQDWDIKPRGQACRDCQSAFADGQTYVSILVFGPQGYVRDDFCENCWQTKGGDLSPYSFWRGIYKEPPPVQEVLQKETAESLLRRLMETNDQSKRNAIFILAVMLERKKILSEKEVQRPGDGSITRVYEHRKTGETFLVPDPQLHLDQLEHVQREVGEMLGGGPKSTDHAQPGQPAPEAATPAATPDDEQGEADEEDEFDEDDEDEDEDEDEDDEDEK